MKTINKVTNNRDKVLIRLKNCVKTQHNRIIELEKKLCEYEAAEKRRLFMEATRA